MSTPQASAELRSSLYAICREALAEERTLTIYIFSYIF